MKYSRYLFVLIFAVSLPAVAGNYSDLWWDPAESGWGINIAQQYDTIFATMFVYDSAQQPHWFTASSLKATAANLSRFSGDLFETSGPWFGAPFNPSGVGVRKVGTMTFTASSGGTSATLNYTVDGISVSKSITRQTWAIVPAAGLYAAQIVNIPVFGECGPEIALDRYKLIGVKDNPGVIGILDESGSGTACTITGPITNNGQLKSLSGTLFCQTNGFSANVLVSDWRVEGGTSFLVGPSALTMTGTIGLTAPSGCHKLYVFSGVILNGAFN